MKITFWGATTGVTGSMSILETTNKIFLVDAGLHQGTDEEDKKNFETLPVVPADIDAIFFTHAHLDHSGYLPRLFKLGFRGDVYCTAATFKLTRIILQDAASLHESSEDAQVKNFYSTQDVIKVLSLCRPQNFLTWIHLDDVRVQFHPAGHILGAAFLEIKESDKKIIFSGDLGRFDDLLIPPPQICPEADLVVMESTYGGKIREKTLLSDLTTFLVKIKREKKIGIIATFAVARAQMLQTLIYEFYQRQPEEELPLFIDSPMLEEANQVYLNFAADTLKPQTLYEAIAKSFTVKSKFQINAKTNAPFLILASSGMLTGGRIWNHLENFQNNPDAVLFLPGFQGEETPGRKIADGERKISNKLGKQIEWQGEVIHSDAFSSHADQNELIAWAQEIKGKIALIHGENQAKLALQALLKKNKQTAFIPKQGESFQV